MGHILVPLPPPGVSVDIRLTAPPFPKEKRITPTCLSRSICLPIIYYLLVTNPLSSHMFTCSCLSIGLLCLSDTFYSQRVSSARFYQREQDMGSHRVPHVEQHIGLQGLLKANISILITWHYRNIIGMVWC